MTTRATEAAAIPTQAVTPLGVNHLVLTVRDMEESHQFWTEIMGFKQVGELNPKPERPNPPKMRFYSGVLDGDVNHHDLALMALPEASDEPGGADAGELKRRVPGINHVAITWPDRESWLRQLAFLQSKGVPFQARVDHGMAHSVYISDPNGHGIEVLYELPRDVWAGDINGALNYYKLLPTEGEEALVDRTENPVFDKR